MSNAQAKYETGNANGRLQRGVTRRGKAFIAARDGRRIEAHVHWCETASKARYEYMCAASEAGYELRFRDIRVTRAPKFDDYDGKYPSNTRLRLVKIDAALQNPRAV